MFASVLILVGCGGKIVETAPMSEPKLAPPAADEDVATVTPPGHSAAPTSTMPVDACHVLCERDARCDTTLPALPAREGETGDCPARCAARLSEKTRCAMDDWLLCYASLVEPDACTPLPDECRPAFCAWARCEKQPVSNCE